MFILRKILKAGFKIMVLLLVLIILIPLVLVAVPYKGRGDAEPVGDISVNVTENSENNETRKGPYPYVFVHGMTGWGENAAMNEKMPYWGFSKEQDLLKYLRENGTEVYAPSVGPLSSAYDRACELYAQLTGTRVDYGKAHSEQYGHERFGRDYTGKAVMGTPWDLKSKINLVGHSFGGPTVRVLVSLLAYGSKAEKDVSGEACSELFKGGNAGGINAVVTLASPHNGSPLSNYMNDPVLPAFITTAVMNNLEKKGATYDPMLSQWGLDRMDLMNDFRLAVSKDQCGYDMTLNGASVLNKKFPTVPTVYYLSYSASLDSKETEKMKESEILKEANKNTGGYKILTKFWKYIRFAGNHTVVDGRILDDSWKKNDGFVPVISAQYPDSEENNHRFFAGGMKPEKGVWTVMPVNEGENHGFYCSPCGNPEKFHEFFDEMIELVNGLE